MMILGEYKKQFTRFYNCLVWSIMNAKNLASIDFDIQSQYIQQGKNDSLWKYPLLGHLSEILLAFCYFIYILLFWI